MTEKTVSYTAGPWEFNEHGIRGGDGPDDFSIRAVNGHRIAFTAGYSAEDEANARLIATAPAYDGILRRFKYFRAAFEAKEYDSGSRAVRELFDDVDAALALIDGPTATCPACNTRCELTESIES